MKKMLSLLLMIFMLVPMASALAEEGGEAVTLDVFYASSRPMNEVTELTRQYMIDNIGVDFNLIQGDGGNYTQQLALYVSSGDMPDVVMCDYSVWRDYALDGAWADLSSYLSEENCPELMTYVGDNWSYMTMDGEVLGVPSMLDVPSSHVTFVRQDWLDNLGLEMPTTLDELTEVLRAFTTQDPDGNGEDDTYGMSGAGYSYLSFIMGAFGASTEEDYFLNDDGTITTNAISEGYREALRYLRDIYAEGLIDPEMFTCTYEQAQGKWGRGEMGVWPAWWSHASNAYLRFDFENLQPDAEVAAMMPPVGPDGLSGNLYSAPFTQVIGVSYLSSEEEIAAAVKLLNFQASPLGFRICMYGIEGEFFEWDPETNTTTWTPDLNDGYSKSGKYKSTDTEVYKMLFHEDWQAQANELIADSDPRKAITIAGSDMRYEEPVREDLFSLILTDEYNTYHSELTTFFSTNMLAFIMGEQDIEADWDAYVAEYLSMGGEEVRQSQLAEYNAIFGTDYTFAE